MSSTEVRPASDSILVIEDDRILRDLIERTLRREHHVTRGAATGSEALALIAAQVPDLLLLDYSLPDMRGEDLIEALAALGLQIPFIVITGHGSEMVAVTMMKRGARDYLSKDQTFLALLPAVVRRVLDQVQQERRLAHAEQQLRASQRRYLTLSGVSPVGIAYCGPDGHCLDVNDRWGEITGLTLDQALQEGWLVAIHPEDRPRVHAQWRAAVSSQCAFMAEYRIVQPGGAMVWVVAQALPDKTSTGEVLGFIRTITDITDRRTAEDALRQSEARMRALVEHLPFDIWACDANLTYILENSTAVRHWGNIIGRSTYDLAVPDEVRSIWLSNNHRALAGEVVRGEVQYLQDGEQRTYFNILAPVRDSGEVRGLVGVNIDVTEQKLAEHNARQHLAQLAHVNRLSTMGQVAAELAHEINQPLYAIGNFAEACSNRVQDNPHVPSEVKQWLRQIFEQAKRSGEIVRRLGQFVRKAAPRRSAVNVNELVRDVVQLLEVELRHGGVRVAYDLGETLPAVIIDRIQIEQVLVNLLRNAVEAVVEMPPGKRRVDIQTRNSDTGIEVAVCDTGRGLPPQQIDRLFEPYFTTKAEGMGMGLAISRSILHEHGGRLWAACDPTGMSFRFTLSAGEVSAE